MTEPFRRSPLSHRNILTCRNTELTLQEIPFLERYILRGAAANLSRIIKSRVGITLPKVSESVSKADVNCLWLSPDEWLFIGPADLEAGLQEKLNSAIEGRQAQVANVGDYYTTISLSGSDAWMCLAKITPFDVDPSVFHKGKVVGSMFAHVPAILHRPNEEDMLTFHLHIRWSHADYLWCMLAESGFESGFERQRPIVSEQMVIPEV